MTLHVVSYELKDMSDVKHCIKITDELKNNGFAQITSSVWIGRGAGTVKETYEELRKFISEDNTLYVSEMPDNEFISDPLSKNK